MEFLLFEPMYDLNIYSGGSIIEVLESEVAWNLDSRRITGRDFRNFTLTSETASQTRG
jgi:hypothetical protein